MFDTADRGAPALFDPSGPAVELGSDETLDADETLVADETLDADGTLQAARAAQRSAHAAEVRLVELAAHWADLHAVLEPVASGVLPGCEQLVDLGGEGTPAVAEFAPTELGCELGLSGYAAERLVADALDLRHRLPRVWARTRAGGFPVWIARRIAEHTRAVPAAAVRRIDARVARWGAGFGWSRLRAIVDAAMAEADPAAAERAARAGDQCRGVWVDPEAIDGSREVLIRTDAASATWFDGALDRVADSLAVLGDPRERQPRRAAAVGILASPQHALDLTGAADAATGTAGAPTGTPTSPDQPVAAGSGHRRGAGAGHRRGVRPEAVVYVHLTDAVLAGGDGVGRLEGAGPVTPAQVREFLGHANVTVRPVLDLAGQAPVDAYEIPDRLREAVQLRSPADAFPYGVSTRRGLDLDHTAPYRPPDEGGPPGQTATANLAPLTRFHHRLKTHGRWQVAQPFDGILVWRSPHGHHYLVDHTGTHRLS